LRSQLVSTINCQQANGETSYATAIEKAEAELDPRGRADLRKVNVFFSDGAANRGPATCRRARRTGRHRATRASPRL